MQVVATLAELLTIKKLANLTMTVMLLTLNTTTHATN